MKAVFVVMLGGRIPPGSVAERLDPAGGKKKNSHFFCVERNLLVKKKGLVAAGRYLRN